MGRSSPASARKLDPPMRLITRRETESPALDVAPIGPVCDVTYRRWGVHFRSRTRRRRCSG